MVEIKEMEKLPEGWRRVRLGEVIKKIGDGGTPSRDNPENFGSFVINVDTSWDLVTHSVGVSSV